MCAHENKDGIFGRILLSLKQPTIKRSKTFLSASSLLVPCDIIYQNYSCAISIKTFYNRSKALLTCSIPYLKFYSIILVHCNHFGSKLDAQFKLTNTDSNTILLIELILNVSGQQTTFAGGRIANHYKFKHSFSNTCGFSFWLHIIYAFINLYIIKDDIFRKQFINIRFCVYQFRNIINFIKAFPMSRCEHNEKIVKFCITANCNNKQSGGCEFCFKKNHCHIGAVKLIKQNQLQDFIKYFTSDQQKKVKNRALREAIYNYLNILKNQISSSIDCLSSALQGRISYPYIWQQGYLNIFKKLKHKDYSKITTNEMRQFCEFKQKSQPEFQQNDISQYFQQCEIIYQKIASLHLIFSEFTQQIQQIQKSESNSTNISIYYNKISQIYQVIQKDSTYRQPKTSKKQIPNKLQKTIQNQKVQRKTQNVQKPEALKIFLQNMKGKVENQVKSTKKKEVQQKLQPQQIIIKKTSQNPIQAKKLFYSDNIQTRNRKVSIDHTVAQPIKIMQTYQDKQKQISQRKKKLDDMINHQKSQNNTNLDKPQSSQQTLIKSQGKNQIQSQNKGQDLFNMLAKQGINFPELIVHTILPAAVQKKKLYEQHTQIKKKTIRIPVRVIQQNEKQDQIQSPILKLKKKSSLAKGFTLGLTKVATKGEKQAQTQNKLQQQQRIKNQPQTLLKQNQANSLFLFMESLKSSAQKAIPWLQASLKYAPNNFSSAQYLSYLYLQCNKPKQCLDVCNKALQLVENQPANHEISFHLINNKAAALNLLGRYSQSIPILQKCLQTTKKDVLYKNLGDAYFNLGIIQKAIINYENATILNDQNHQAFYNLGVCLFSQKNYYSCKMKVQKALMLDQQNQSYIDLYNEVNKLIKSS